MSPNIHGHDSVVVYCKQSEVSYEFLVDRTIRFGDQYCHCQGQGFGTLQERLDDFVRTGCNMWVIPHARVAYGSVSPATAYVGQGKIVGGAHVVVIGGQVEDCTQGFCR
jgi:hypothetical protein